MSERAVPFHCPFCAEEDIRPHLDENGESPRGAWECHACQRAFSVRMLGLLAPRGERR